MSDQIDRSLLIEEFLLQRQSILFLSPVITRLELRENKTLRSHESLLKFILFVFRRRFRL